MMQIRGYEALNYFYSVGHMFFIYLTHFLGQLDSTTQSHLQIDGLALSLELWEHMAFLYKSDF